MKKLKELKCILLFTTVIVMTFLGSVQAKASTADNFDYTSGNGWWSTNSGYDANKISDTTVSGDFDGDGRTDIATMYDYGNGESRIHVFKSTGSSFSYTDCNGWWKANGYDTQKVKGRMVSGDFDGDGKDDIATMYDYGNQQSRIHVFISTGSSFSYTDCNGWWEANGYDANSVTGRMVSGDFNGDGKDDIAAMYNYGTESRIHVFESTGSSFSYTDCNGWWKSNGYYDSSKVTSRVVSGDFNGDGKDDIAAMYDYGSLQSRIHVFESTGSSFSYTDCNGWWKATGYDSNQVTDRMVAGDFNGDGKSDIATMYNYGTQSRIHVFESTGSSFSYTDCNGWWNSEGYYDSNKVTGRMVEGNFNGVGSDDIAAFYDYDNTSSRIHTWLSKFNQSIPGQNVNNGTVYSKPTSGCGGLTTEQEQANARYIYNYMTSKGWSKNAICAMLGNMEAESGMNPCAWQVWHQTGPGYGFGLVQWTPATNYLNWAGITPNEADAMPAKDLIDGELNRILYDLANGGQWYATNKAPYYMSFKTFTQSYNSTYNLALTWQASYERPQYNQNIRGDNAVKWYNFLK